MSHFYAHFICQQITESMDTSALTLLQGTVVNVEQNAEHVAHE